MRLLSQISLAFLFVFFSSCASHLETIDKLLITNEDIEFAADNEDEVFVEVITNVKSWSASASVEWISIDRVSDGFYVTVEPYTDAGKDRIGRITVTAGDANPVNVIVMQYRVGTVPAENITAFNSCVGYYFGDVYEIGTALFLLELYNTFDKQTSVFIEGFCTLPSNFANFSLDEGAYFNVETGDAKTFLAGRPDDESFYGSAVANFSTERYLLITGGFFTLSLSNNIYTINTCFTGKDAHSGVVANDIRMKYTGRITFLDLSE